MISYHCYIQKRDSRIVIPVFSREEHIMQNVKRVTSLIVMVSCLFLSVFLFALSVKALSFYSKQYGSIPSSVSGVFIVQLLFSFLILGIAIAGATFLLRSRVFDTTPTRFVNMELLAITLMELIQIIILLGEANKASGYGASSSLDIKIVLGMVFLIISILLLLLGTILAVDPYGPILAISGITLNVVTFIVTMDLSTYVLSVLDALLILTYILAVFYSLSSFMLESRTSTVLYSEPSYEQKVIEQPKVEPAHVEEKKLVERDENCDGVMVNNYFYRNEKGESASIGAQTQVKIIGDNGDGTYNISYKDGKKIIKVDSVNSFYIKKYKK